MLSSYYCYVMHIYLLVFLLIFSVNKYIIQFLQIVYSEYNRKDPPHKYYKQPIKIKKLQQMNPQKTIIRVHPPVLHPKFTSIGYGNPRYNSMVILADDTIIIPCGTSVRRINLINNQILYAEQIGCSQIFQILENQLWVMVVNFQGLVSLIRKSDMKVEKQFHVGGKEIRHSAFSKEYIVVSCELNDGTKQALLQIFSIQDIISQQGVLVQVKPKYRKMGYFYYPQIAKQNLIFIQFDDPNPKGRSRTQTVMNIKLPVKHRILKKSLINWNEEPTQVCSIKFEGQIICACQNVQSRQVFYQHQSKRVTVLNTDTLQCNQFTVVTTASPLCIQPYKNGIILASQTSQLTYLQFTQNPIIQHINLKIKGLTTCFSIKKSLISDSFVFFNQNGLQFYNSADQKIYTQNLFDITNCGISFNEDGTKFAVADFGGNVFTIEANQKSIVPVPLTRVFVGIPVRSLVWCWDTNNIIIGCVGGYLFNWDGVSEQAVLIKQTNDHTVNIVRYFNGFIIFGTSDGFVHIMDSPTLTQVYKFQSHHPVHYQNQKQRQLFGSMKNYAEIWSIIAYPCQQKNQFNLVTCSEDQTQKVYRITISQNGQFNHNQIHHLVGHSLAVTSIDWKPMASQIGALYVSCSDDKIVRFRNPENMFEIIHQLETSTIKQWHTLTYLALEPNGKRVAIGSQNGYLFIFDILAKELLFGEKIHLGGVEGMDWRNGKLITCSSDLCLSIAYL